MEGVEFLELTHPMPEALYGSALPLCGAPCGDPFSGKALHHRRVKGGFLRSLENKLYAKSFPGNSGLSEMDRQQWNAPFEVRKSRLPCRSLYRFQKVAAKVRIRNKHKDSGFRWIYGGTIMNIMEEYAARPRLMNGR